MGMAISPCSGCRARARPAGFRFLGFSFGLRALAFLRLPYGINVREILRAS